MPVKEGVRLDSGEAEVRLRLTYGFASTGSSKCFLYSKDGKSAEDVSAVSEPDGAVSFSFPGPAALGGRIVFLESHVFAVANAPAPVGATVVVLQGSKEVCSLSDSATIVDAKKYAIFKFAIQFAA